MRAKYLRVKSLLSFFSPRFPHLLNAVLYYLIERLEQAMSGHSKPAYSAPFGLLATTLD